MEGAPVRNENSHTTVPDNIAWLHYYTPSEDWLITRRFFDIRDRKVFCKPMFYAATTGGRLHSNVAYDYVMLNMPKINRLSLL